LGSVGSGLRQGVHRYPERVNDADRPEEPSGPTGLFAETPLAAGSVAAGLAGVVLGFVFVPQLLALALGGLSLARREPGGRGRALLGIALGLACTVAWGVVLALLLRWWAASR
jgi:hypothetical protein